MKMMRMWYKRDLDNINDWSDKWAFRFNYQKCNHMHLGNENYVATYYMNNNGELKEINKVTEQKDFGVLIDDKLKIVPHIQAMVKKANRNLEIIKRTFSYLDKSMYLSLNKAIIRPHLEYASTVWSVIYKKDCISNKAITRWNHTQNFKNSQ